MSTTETEDTLFKTVFLINLVEEEKVNILKEANLTIALSAEDYVTYLRAVLATHGKTEYKSIYPVSKPFHKPLAHEET
ncbi:hypothetical protein BDR04DRAFT_1089967 [Suillus decipiens]|nr:hypothetical protein BDR04DRAFT_1089967 [Suillus decipiens]